MLIDLATKAGTGDRGRLPGHGAHFPETLAFVEEVRARYDLNLTVTKPGPEAEAYPCGSRAVLPVPQGRAAATALAGRRAWITALKRADAPTRADAPIVGWDEGFGLVKVNPLATWTDDDIAAYLADHDLPVHPLWPRGTSRSAARRPPARSPRGRTLGPDAGRGSTRPSAGCTPSAP